MTTTPCRDCGSVDACPSWCNERGAAMETSSCEYLDKCDHQYFLMNAKLNLWALHPMCLIARGNCLIRRGRLAKEAPHD
jgi:hypothetical protein